MKKEENVSQSPLNLSTKKNREEKVNSPPGLKLLVGTTKSLRSHFREFLETSVSFFSQPPFSWRV